MSSEREGGKLRQRDRQTERKEAREAVEARCGVARKPGGEKEENRRVVGEEEVKSRRGYKYAARHLQLTFTG